MIEQLGGCIPFGVWLVCVCGGVVCKRMKTVKKKVEEREKKKKNGNGTTKKQAKKGKQKTSIHIHFGMDVVYVVSGF